MQRKQNLASAQLVSIKKIGGNHAFSQIIKAPFTLQKMFGTARIKMIHVQKYSTDVLFTRRFLFFCSAKRCEKMFWYGKKDQHLK